MKAPPRRLRTRTWLLPMAVWLACTAVFAVTLGINGLDGPALASEPVEIRITADGLIPDVISVTLGSPVVWANQTDALVNLAPGPLYRRYLPLVAGAVDAHGPDVETQGRSWTAVPDTFGATLAPGDVYTHTFAVLGFFPYHATAPARGISLRGEVRVDAVPPPSPTPGPPQLTYQVLQEYPHDPAAFTQGLVFDDGYLYEGTGRYGQSSLRQVDLVTGEVLRIRELAADYFGEGVAVFDADRIAQLTWKAGLGFIYDKEDFQLLRQFEYETEGWGLAYDGASLIMSDGTATLHFLDPHTLEEQRTVQVYDLDGPVNLLNELEVIRGVLYANVWLSDTIAVIDLNTGQVIAWIDLHGLLSPEEAAEANVLNGIAYDAAGDRLFVTGKLWPRLFEIRLVPRGAVAHNP